MRKLPWNWRDRIELVRDDDWGGFHRAYRWQWIKGKTPRGFNHRWIGEILLCKENYIKNVELDDKFQGKGLGIAMYKRALHDSGVLRTRFHNIRPPARRCWMSLKRDYRHNIDFWAIGGLLEVFA